MSACHSMRGMSKQPANDVDTERWLAPFTLASFCMNGKPVMLIDRQGQKKCCTCRGMQSLAQQLHDVLFGLQCVYACTGRHQCSSSLMHVHACAYIASSICREPVDSHWCLQACHPNRSHHHPFVFCPDLFCQFFDAPHLQQCTFEVLRAFQSATLGTRLVGVSQSCLSEAFLCST